MAKKSGTHWQCQLSSSGERLAFLLQTGLLSDLTITFPGQHKALQAHRLVLAMSSPVFEAMLCGPMAEGDVLHLPEDPPEAFYWLLDHLYRDINQFPNVAMAIKVYQLATKYQMDILCDICSQYLISEVNVDNFPVIFDTAVLLEDGHLLNRCGEVMAVSTDDILSSCDFYLLKNFSLVAFLSHQDLAPSSEGLVFRALMRWAEKKLNESYSQTGMGNSNLSLAVSPPIYKNGKESKVMGEPKSSSKHMGRTMAACSSKSDVDQPYNSEEYPNRIETSCPITMLEPKKTQFQDSNYKHTIRNEIEEFLPLIRFLLMTTDEFVLDVMSSGVLSNEECVAILMNIKDIPNVPLPKFMSSPTKKNRNTKVKSSTVMFCQHHFGINDQEILRKFSVSRSIFVSQIKAPAVLSKNITDVTISSGLHLSKIVANSKWHGTSCNFDKPVKLVPGESYSVVVGSAYGPCSGCECIVSSEVEDIEFDGKTLGLCPVYIDFWEAEGNIR